MSFNINRELEWNQVSIDTDDVNYLVYVSETGEGSNLWTLNISNEEGRIKKDDIYKLMSTISDVIFKGKDSLAENSNIKEMIYFVYGNTEQEIDKRSKVFSRWIKKPWTFEIIKNPTIDIQGKANKVYLKSNLIHIKKNEDYIEETPKIIGNIKFCFNCGTENKAYKFCPSCGTNLQQS